MKPSPPGGGKSFGGRGPRGGGRSGSTGRPAPTGGSRGPRGSGGPPRPGAGDRRDARPSHSARGDRPPRGPVSEHTPGGSRDTYAPRAPHGAPRSGPRRPADGLSPDTDRRPAHPRRQRPVAPAPRPPRPQAPRIAIAPVRMAADQRAAIATSIEAYAKELGITAPHLGWGAFLARFQEQILGQNNAVNLTTIVEPGDFLVRHHMDSLATVRAVPELLGATPLNIVDIGTGAGFPGIPLWAALPLHHYTLIDGTAKKVRCVEQSFRAAMDECLAEGAWPAGGEAALELLAERSELLARQGAPYAGGFDLALARATGPGLEVFENAVDLIRPGGALVLYFGDQPARGEPELLEALQRRGIACTVTPAFEIVHGPCKLQRRHCIIRLS